MGRGSPQSSGMVGGGGEIPCNLNPPFLNILHDIGSTLGM